jgi:glycerol-3-phosphate dehydrogenase
MNREGMIRRLAAASEPWDLAVIGGGATGLGIAVDAASRGYQVVLLEKGDFGSGTSSRSTKLVHGGVRYLKQAQFALVSEALHERALLLRNAPHLVQILPFVVPAYSGFDRWFYGAGLHLYAKLARRYGLGATRLLGRQETLRLLPNANPEGLTGGVLYYDAQFDDARLAVALAKTAAQHGAAVLNYMEVTGWDGRVLRAVDRENGEEYAIRSRIAVNAAGPWCDQVRRLGQPKAAPTLTLSRGSHAVVEGSFLPGSHALLVPKTSDGRVMFAIPWQGYTVLGTTDVETRKLQNEPKPSRREIESILATAGRYLGRTPEERHVLSVWAGLRPLLKPNTTEPARAIPREHRILMEQPSLMTVEGGKWTSYRHMAEQAVNAAAEYACLPRRVCVTRDLPVAPVVAGGGDAAAANARAFIREEMARTVEDVLARRSRLLFLDSRRALSEAPAVASAMAPILGWSGSRVTAELERFSQIATNYMVSEAE